MNFDQIASDANRFLTWLEAFATTPKEKIDLEGFAALARTATRIKAALAPPEAAADIALIGAMVKQDMPSLDAPPAPPVEAEPAPEAQDSGRPSGANRGGLMKPGT